MIRNVAFQKAAKVKANLRSAVPVLKAQSLTAEQLIDIPRGICEVEEYQCKIAFEITCADKRFRRLEALTTAATAWAATAASSSRDNNNSMPRTRNIPRTRNSTI